MDNIETKDTIKCKFGGFCYGEIEEECTKCRLIIKKPQTNANKQPISNGDTGGREEKDSSEHSEA
jgi:hypothetical protein